MSSCTFLNDILFGIAAICLVKASACYIWTGNFPLQLLCSAKKTAKENVLMSTEADAQVLYRFCIFNHLTKGEFIMTVVLLKTKTKNKSNNNKKQP